jgi:hypothetical protein
MRSKRPRGSARPATLFDRFVFAAIGAVLGAIVGVPLGFMFVQGAHLGPWVAVPWTSGAGALVGFVFLERVGDFLGELIAGAYQARTGEGGDVVLPTWLAVVLAAAVCVALWWYFH